MSLINKVLQDLDQRSAMSAPDSAPPPRQVRALPPVKSGREWFWGMVGALMLVALAWVAWIAWQLQPRPLATDLAFQAAEQAKQKKQALISRGTAQKPAAPAEKPAALAEKPAPEAKAPAAPTELFKLAPSIDTPIVAAVPNAPATKTPKPAVPAKPKADKPMALTPAPAIAAKPSALASKLEKHEQPRSAADRAETEYRRGAALLNQGRISEAEAAMSAALAADPAHEPARQALVALYIEQGRSQEASRLLQDGLALNPAQVRFAIVLARLHAERGDHASALDILNRVKPSAGADAEFNSLLGGVLQRLKRHAEAADAYRAAVQAVPHSGISWVGLGISLEALARRPEAAEAFRRAVATGTLTAEVKGYAEQRARALH